jgi:hypothetical protein
VDIWTWAAACWMGVPLDAAERFAQLPDCSNIKPGSDFVCDRKKGHKGDHFGGNAGGSSASWPQHSGARIEAILEDPNPYRKEMV